MDLFDQPNGKSDNRPLAERMRPRTLDEYIGQGHILGAESLLRRSVAEDRLFSVIFWGPPGSGKTTLARIMAQETKSHFMSFSAVLSGVKEIRGVVEEAAQFVVRRLEGRSHLDQAPRRAPMCEARSDATASTSAASAPSTMTRASASVPE